MRISALGPFGMTVSVVDRSLVECWPLNSSYTSVEAFHRHLSEVYGQNGTTDDPLTAESLEAVHSSLLQATLGLAKEPLAFTAARPFTILKVLVVASDQDPESLLLVSQ
jgi:hypothetical protein